MLLSGLQAQERTVRDESLNEAALASGSARQASRWWTPPRQDGLLNFYEAGVPQHEQLRVEATARPRLRDVRRSG